MFLKVRGNQQDHLLVNLNQVCQVEFKNTRVHPPTDNLTATLHLSNGTAMTLKGAEALVVYEQFRAQLGNPRA